MASAFSPRDYAQLLALQHPELSANAIYRQMRFEGRGGRRTDVLKNVAEARQQQQKTERQLRSTPTKYLPKLGREGLKEKAARIRRRIAADEKKGRKAKTGRLPEVFQPQYRPGEVEFLERLREGGYSGAGLSEEEWEGLLDEERQYLI